MVDGARGPTVHSPGLPPHSRRRRPDPSPTPDRDIGRPRRTTGGCKRRGPEVLPPVVSTGHTLGFTALAGRHVNGPRRVRLTDRENGGTQEKHCLHSPSHGRVFWYLFTRGRTTSIPDRCVGFPHRLSPVEGPRERDPPVPPSLTHPHESHSTGEEVGEGRRRRRCRHTCDRGSRTTRRPRVQTSDTRRTLCRGRWTSDRTSYPGNDEWEPGRHS